MRLSLIFTGLRMKPRRVCAENDNKKEEEAAAFGGDEAVMEQAVKALAVAKEEAEAEVLFDSSLLREREAKIAALEREVLSLRNQESEREKIGSLPFT